jgi:hypothetical protein
MNKLELDKIKIEGNSIFIRTIPQTGIIALTSFVDNTTGTVSNKSFRYSTRWYSVHRLATINSK